MGIQSPIDAKTAARAAGGAGPSDSADTTTFQVVTNDEGRFALWPLGRTVPAGWQVTAARGTRDSCLGFVRRNWSALEIARPAAKRPSAVRFGLIFFGDTQGDAPEDKYRLLMEVARFADRSGFAGLWLPERHFTRFGCLYPSPAVLHAAIARETEQLRLRAGSVVLPLHNPIRVAEDWAVVDNLSGGRVDLSFASGWHPDDFALNPDVYERRYDEMYRSIDLVRRLWRGEKIPATSGNGQPIEVGTFPTPIQHDVPIWITAAGSPQTFERAGEAGFNVLTHLFDQRLDKLGDNIRAFRQARERAGLDPDTGEVTVVLHTFVAPSLDEVREHAHQPYCNYLRSNMNLLKGLAFSRGMEMDLSSLPADQLQEMLDAVFEKFLGGRSLLGTPETCAKTVSQLVELGVKEVACLMDFGPSDRAIIDHLPHLKTLVDRCTAQATASAPTATN